MCEKVQLKGGICEFDFGYNAKMEGYTTLMSDIPTLSAIDWHKDEAMLFQKTGGTNHGSRNSCY
uniref:Uncharacterized protein n=1 Tax=Uncultured archaeon GZfos26G2 TaxID=3386331 RepID=Q64D83_UNCAG|nr:hypothetical protein GZ18H11_17 [uncultured archaeon GZfos18H11]